MDRRIPVRTALDPPTDAAPARPGTAPGRPPEAGARPRPTSTMSPGHHDRAVDGGALVRLDGELDLHTAPGFAQVLRSAQADGTTVVLDLRRLAFIDCVGLAVISAADHRARLSRSRLILLVRAGGAVDRLLEITGTSGRFETTTRLPMDGARGVGRLVA